MDDRNHNGGSKGSPGMIEKAASLRPHEVTEAELKAINKYALEPLTMGRFLFVINCPV